MATASGISQSRPILISPGNVREDYWRPPGQVREATATALPLFTHACDGQPRFFPALPERCLLEFLSWPRGDRTKATDRTLTARMSIRHYRRSKPSSPF